MKDLLPLTDNFVFKAIFSQNPDLLLDLLNSFPEFQKTKRIEKGKIETAIQFLNFGMSVEQVSKITGLSMKQILNYRKNSKDKTVI
ncbi:MAG: hypothetical protein SFU98_00495 [Leptospiraceae bacterium]|nr:hypothetical protein [Leptospiraceae bacterium]